MPRIAEPIYTLDLTMDKCYVRAYLNGFPVYSYNAFCKSNFSMPLNAYLAGGINNLKIEVLPCVHPERKVSLVTDVKIEGGIKIYENGAIAAADLGEIILAISESDFKLEAFPLSLEKQFDNYGPKFRRLFYLSKQFDDEEALKKYGIKLRDLMRQKDVKALLDEFKPKLTEFAEAYYDEPEDYYEQFTTFMSNDFIPANPQLGFVEEQIVVKSWCDKRLWEIGLMPDEELFETEPNDEDQSYVIKIFAANTNDGLKVVR